MLTAQVETLTGVLPELKPLFPGHFEELALNKDKVPLDPHYELYFALEAQGQVMVVTLRENAAIMGYFIGFVRPGLHYQTCLTLIMDIFYVCPEHRGKGGGVMLFKAVEREARRRGVQRMFVGSKKHKEANANALFDALGYEPVETHYSKWLGD